MTCPLNIDTNIICCPASNFSLEDIMTLSLFAQLFAFTLSFISVYKKDYWHFNI